MRTYAVSRPVCCETLSDLLPVAAVTGRVAHMYAAWPLPDHAPSENADKS